ncbi:MAG: hypothetical protein LAT55_11475 [Opitutales bacterium]|nr:hypothetical protein [Opitutales bacterium]
MVLFTPTQVKSLLLAGSLSFGLALTASSQEGQPMLPPEGAPQQETSQAEARLQELQAEFQQIAGQLNEVQQQALERDDVQDAINTYEALMQDKISDFNEDAPEMMERQEELVEKLQAPGAQENEAEFQQNYEEYMQLNETLEPIQQELSQDPEIREANQNIEATVVAAMTDIDENAESMIDRLEEIEQEGQQLMMQMQQQQQQQQPQGGEGGQPQPQMP